MKWKEGAVAGCVVRPLRRYPDDRGWLAEFFRHDELAEEFHPAMGYISLTHAGVARGPHEHVDQADGFVFFEGTYRVYLWDSRKDSPTCGCRHVFEAGEKNPTLVVVPKGVVHAYKNVGTRDAHIVNVPNRLYAGRGKKEKVDEIRHEDDQGSPFQLEW